ncbi:hypothetical protein SK128_007050 [Halocaridina rubra]|uniref:GST N-terminal domain-containing protein n=1 Tax=Halocaridina rubra TaxID=373956 RepID=A0AAN8X1C4_HALRR
MPKYKLIYFDGRGRAELARWLFAYGGIPFVDERIDFNDWPKHKANYPTGQLPVLMIDDQLLTEPIAIARYIAKEVDLLPKDNLEAAFCDALVDNSVQVKNGWVRLG